ncbi:membrane dipeptidase [Anaerovirgula multivorans]|uniref:Membrane dipeptidase n=1 Tax=Anaerovirgula multivorans TaxID=312168 RepID=A0A239DCG4_9FIRM|nr:dipeptidase [Anaerovirgula multivorans]SNS29581.1 membrane dipeptidase [Anaerovirgula multivorans]
MIFDGHTDIWTDITNKYIVNNMKDVFRKNHFKKFNAGNVNGGIFVIWVDPPYDIDPAHRVTQVIECMQREIKYAQDILNVIKNHEDYFKIEDTRIKVLIGMEGLSHIDTNITLLQQYYELGVRHASLTWNEENKLATGVLGDKNRGLTSDGCLAVKEIERLGMLLDVSHLNNRSFWDVVDIVSKPIIASHSNTHALCAHDRNLNDLQLKSIADSGGLVGVNSFRTFVHRSRNKQNIDGLVEHIQYIANLIGIDHVAFGFDFCDYIDNTTLNSFYDSAEPSPGIDGLNEVSQVNDLITALRNAGFTKDEIEKITYKNYGRVMKAVLK